MIVIDVLASANMVSEMFCDTNYEFCKSLIENICLPSSHCINIVLKFSEEFK